MKSSFQRSLLASILALSSMSIEAAGFRSLHIADPGHPDIKVGVWYPSDQSVPNEANTEFELPMAVDASLSDTNGSLILISHGFGGWYAGHADTAAALADQGFIVAAPSHTGNTWSDMSSSVDQWALDRPRHVSLLIDHLLEDPLTADAIDADKIAVYGFSAGGHTALGLIGALPDFSLGKQHCALRPEEFVCAEGMLDAMLSADMSELPDKAWGFDPRIKAAAIAAPGFGFAYSRQSLAGVATAVQLWSGESDMRVPTESNAQNIADNLPRAAQTRWIDNANHFAFMTVACREAFKLDDPVEYEMVCGDAEGFDRYEFHDQMHRHMGEFFRASLGIAE